MSASISHRRASSVRLNLPPPSDFKHIHHPAARSMSSAPPTTASSSSSSPRPDAGPSSCYIPAPEKSHSRPFVHPMPPLKGSLSRSFSNPFAPHASTATTPLLASYLASIPRRTLRFRNALLALFAVTVVSVYLLYSTSPTLASYSSAFSAILPSSQPAAPPPAQSRLFRLPRERQKPLRPQVELTQPQELAAVVSFLASLPQNVIPNIDPSQPIDPQLVCDFDTRSDRALQELAELTEDVWTRNPVVLFTRERHQLSREVKAVIDSLDLYPSPTVFDVDTRDDADVLMPLLARLTHVQDLPLVLVGGRAVAARHLRQLSETGELEAKIQEAGGLVGGAAVMRKGRKH